MSSSRIGIDVGGTFTDGILRHADGRLTVAKVRSRPDDIAGAILDCVRSLGADPAEVEAFVHGTTVGTNAIIEKSGPRIAHVTTQGFRDVLFIRRGDSPPFALQWTPPAPVVARRDIFEVSERLRWDGGVERPFDEAEARRVATIIGERGYPAVSVTFLHSYADDRHERRMREILEELAPQADVSLSSEILPHFREFERSSTTAVNAYLVPLVRDYLEDLGSRAAAEGFTRQLLVMQSNGGVTTTDDAQRSPARTVRSGPAGGAVAALEIARQVGADDAVLIDMGGTSTEVAVLQDGAVRWTPQLEFSWGVPIRFPSVDIHSVGAGGGSIAWVEEGGLLKVGPHSAGAVPGPASYDQGGEEPTTTDAQIVLGRLSGESLLGGAMQIRGDLAEQAIERRVAAPLGLGLDEAARGILAVNTNHLVQAVRLMTVNRGVDPRGSALIAYGGSGGLYAAEAAAILGIERVVIPPHGGLNSALGMVQADFRYDRSQTLLKPLTEVDPATLALTSARLEAALTEQLDGARIAPEDRAIDRVLDVRYDGQGYELAVPLPDGPIDAATVRQAAADFHERHERELGWRDESWPLELVFLRVNAVGRVHGTDAPAASTDAPDVPTPRSHRTAGFLDHPDPRDTPVFQRDDLHPGLRLSGPAIVEQLDTTTIVPPDYELAIDGYRNLILTRTADTNAEDA